MDFDMFNIPVINLDYYNALGLKEADNPSIEDIQNAYRHLALQWHPERNKTSSKRETASLKFIEINEAYKILMDKKLREAKQAAKAAKSKKPERVLSPGRATSPGPTSPTGVRPKSRPRWSAAASRIVSGMHGGSQPEATVNLEGTRSPSPKPEEPLMLPQSEASRSSIAPPRSAVASPPASHLSAPLPMARQPSAAPSREPSPALPGAFVPSSKSSNASWISTPSTRAYPEDRDSRASSVRSPPAIYTVDEDVRARPPRYLRAMSELGLSDLASVSGGYTSSVFSSSSTASSVPDDWLFPVYLTLEDLYTCKTHRFKINRHLLNGSSKEVFVDLSVQPNWRDGTQLRCKGLGNEREGLPPQDVIFVVKEKLHPRFLRDPVGYDIYARLEISLVIALGGGSVNDEALLIKGVDGSEITVEVPPPVVRHGSMTRIKGAGMPKYKSKDGSVPLRGDLILEWCVLPPDKPLSEEAMAELREALGDGWLRDEEEEN